MNSRALVLSLIFFFTYHFSVAQYNIEVDHCYFCYEHSEGSPYKSGFKSELPFLLVSAGALGAGLIFKYTNTTQPYTVAELEELNRNDVNEFDRGATYNWDENAKHVSDILIVSSLVLPAVLLVNHHTRSDIFPLLLMSLEVATINFGLTASVKNIANRARPYVYNENLPDEQRTNAQSRFSYFSGHTSVTASFSFFFAKVLNDYHPDMKTAWKIGMWTFAATIPAATGYLRVKSGYHFRTDVITGYAVGALTGWLIPHLHKKKKLSEKLSLYPTRVFDSGGIGMTLKF